MRWVLVWAGLLAGVVWAQEPCANVAVFQSCEYVFTLSAQELAAHPNPYKTVDIHAEFNTPKHRTIELPAYWDGGGRFVIRVAPHEDGLWEYRVTSNVKRFDGQKGQFTAKASEAPGFIQPANVHHWQYTGSRKAHLWVGATSYSLAAMPASEAAQVVNARAQQKFNHMRLLALGPGNAATPGYAKADQPNPAHFQALDAVVRQLNQHGMVADLILGNAQDQLTKLFPDPEDRRRYVKYMVARYSAFSVTWQGIQQFETYHDGRAVAKEIGTALKEIDPYQHPRSTDAVVTSSPLLSDGWMNFLIYQTGDDQIGAIEHQLYQMPAVNAGFVREGAAATDEARRRLWNAAMDGQYPSLPNGDGAAKEMTVWRDFFAGTRYWELEPYFDVDGGRAVALTREFGEPGDDEVKEGIEYVVYVERPGPVEVSLIRHKYDVEWVNPINGEAVPEKEYKGEHFTGQPPDSKHDWVLHISREGRKQSLLSYKFESRPVPVQEVEANSPKTPYAIEQPVEEELSASRSWNYSVKLTRQSRATRSMMYLWTGDVTADNQGFRVLGTGAQGTFQIPKELVRTLPGVFNVRVMGLNAAGKLYSVDKVYRLVR